MNHLQFRKEEGIGWVSINHPPANALNRASLEELEQLFAQMEEDQSIRAVILHGEGRFFAAGADIKEFTQIDTVEAGIEMARLGQQLFNTIEGFNRPVIAAIHGAALGGGLELAMSCHIRLGTPETKLGLPELNLGLIPGWGGTQRLPRLVGKARALEMILTSRIIDGEEGYRIGLLNRLVTQDQLLDEALHLAQAICGKSKLTVIKALEAVRETEHSFLDEGLMKEAEFFGQSFSSKDMREGVQAFLEKRAPHFVDE